MTEDEFFGRGRRKPIAIIRPISEQVRNALRGCGDRSTDEHERAAFRELTEAITPEGASLLRRFLI